ncbi:MAG: NYN domain-containing protein [Patescibacteria group bacterium]|jgi:uncharacterized LabA/DUF88 family protein|nr:NYN domain-containing protein [Patescibacteria group bacterium]MDD5173083.1 NYN domain-containing protein [Patescibacteria group bacterium]
MKIFRKQKVCIYIDGNNFYKYLKNKEIDFPKGTKFDFKKFSEYLTGERECISKRYYIGIVRNFDHSKRSQELVMGQQKFISKIKNDGFIVKPGRIIYDQGKIREKGTDVKIAVDLITGAIDDYYDTAILVSSDTDLIPAIKYVKFKNKRIEYIGFSHRPSLGIQKYATLSKLLSSDDLEKFKGI